MGAATARWCWSSAASTATSARGSARSPRPGGAALPYGGGLVTVSNLNPDGLAARHPAERPRGRPEPQLRRRLAADRRPRRPRALGAAPVLGARVAARPPSHPRPAPGRDDLVSPAGRAAGAGLGTERARGSALRAARRDAVRAPAVDGRHGAQLAEPPLSPGRARSWSSCRRRGLSHAERHGLRSSACAGSCWSEMAEALAIRLAGQSLASMSAESAKPLIRLASAGPRPRREGALVRDAQRGSSEALEELFRRHWRRAHRAAYLVVGDPVAAEDIAQESFLAAVRALDRFDRRRPFGPWLHRIAVNRAIDFARARALRGEDALAARRRRTRPRARRRSPTSCARRCTSSRPSTARWSCFAMSSTTPPARSARSSSSRGARSTRACAAASTGCARRSSGQELAVSLDRDLAKRAARPACRPARTRPSNGRWSSSAPPMPTASRCGAGRRSRRAGARGRRRSRGAGDRPQPGGGQGRRSGQRRFLPQRRRAEREARAALRCLRPARSWSSRRRVPGSFARTARSGCSATTTRPPGRRTGCSSPSPTAAS